MSHVHTRSGRVRALRAQVLRRQTDRVAKSGTVSKDSLLTLQVRTCAAWFAESRISQAAMSFFREYTVTHSCQQAPVQKNA